jgi:hypothetical protein
VSAFEKRRVGRDRLQWADCVEKVDVGPPRGVFAVGRRESREARVASGAHDWRLDGN